MKPLSIIIPSLNEQDYLPTLLDSIIDQDYVGTYEVIVVDGGSSDKTSDVVSAYKKRLPMLSFYAYDKGISRQRNYGAKKAKYDALIFLDADMKLSKHALKNIAERVASKEDFIAIPFMSTYAGKPVDYFFVAMTYIYSICVQWTNPITTGMCIITTKQVHDRIGGFNERLTYAEDIDYGLRAYRSGSRYHIFFSVFMKTSARRLDQLGRMRVARTWLRWYRARAKHGAVIDESNSDYDFGEFKKNR
jgi:glycosyltransferase involved in cell wall biosynthesis